MLNFSVKENQGGWSRETSHPFRLLFTEKTKVMLQTNEKHQEFPKSVCNIIAYADIINSPDVEAPNLIVIWWPFINQHHQVLLFQNHLLHHLLMVMRSALPNHFQSYPLRRR
ncbi:unnamed protein product [Cuscuta europaea]|nr:unnamed protein product [Cuscuta europaea]